MSLLKDLRTLLIVLLVLPLAVFGYLYVTDYAVEANVKDKQCFAGLIVVETKLFGYDSTVSGVPPELCAGVQPGNFAKYYLRSGRTVLYTEEGGACIYDTAHKCVEEGRGVIR